MEIQNTLRFSLSLSPLWINAGDDRWFSNFRTIYNNRNEFGFASGSHSTLIQIPLVTAHWKWTKAFMRNPFPFVIIISFTQLPWKKETWIDKIILFFLIRRCARILGISSLWTHHRCMHTRFFFRGCLHSKCCKLTKHYPVKYFSVSNIHTIERMKWNISNRNLIRICTNRNSRRGMKKINNSFHIVSRSLFI